MKYFIVEEDKIIKPLFKSNFPIVKRRRDDTDFSARIVKQFLFRLCINVYVNDVETYRELGGKFGETKVERFRALDYPSWFQLTGIKSYDLPEFKLASPIKGGCYPTCFCIKRIDQRGDRVSISSEILEKADSCEGLTKVVSVYFDYIKSWGLNINKEAADIQIKKATKWFESRLIENKITQLSDAEQFLDSILAASADDCGIVRKSKSYDHVMYKFVAKKFIQNQSHVALGPDDIPYKDEIRLSAKHLYGLVNDMCSYESVYDSAFVEQLIKSVKNIERESDYLAIGIRDKTVNVSWAKKWVTELRSECFESGFPFNKRGDTEYSWNRINNVFNFIKDQAKN